jgi:hypothetical protein
MKNRGLISWMSSKKETKWKEVWPWVERCNSVPVQDKVALSIIITDRILNGDLPNKVRSIVPMTILHSNNASIWADFLHNPKAIKFFYNHTRPLTLFKMNEKISKIVVYKILGG